MLSQREEIRKSLEAILPLDSREQLEIEAALALLDSGEEFIRNEQPDWPPRHFVSYFVLYDSEADRILLVDHIKANLWLPSGGHMEQGEAPWDTVRREAAEELGIEARPFLQGPLFLTINQTNDLATRHEDISLWYVLEAQENMALTPDPTEFHAVAWYSLDEILWERSDPNMKRFIAKLGSRMAALAFP